MNLLQAKTGQFMMPRIDRALQDNLMNPVYGFNNRVTGAADKYGNLIEGTDPLSSLRSTREAGGIGDGGFEPEVKPVDPETGQCDEGYMFDEDMQACRLDTSSNGRRSSRRRSSRTTRRCVCADGFAGSGANWPASVPAEIRRWLRIASRLCCRQLCDFRRRGAYQPEYFDQPYPTTGYTLLS